MYEMTVEQAIQHPEWPLAAASWLLDEGSLTKKLGEHYGDDVRLDVYVDSWGEPISSVETSVGAPHERLWVREVAWVSARRWLLARTVIPESTLIGPGEVLSQLGARPMGEVLFSDATLSRSLSFAYCQSGDGLHQWACQYEPTVKEQALWARHSQFLFYGRPLLLQEVFLPVGLREVASLAIEER